MFYETDCSTNVTSNVIYFLFLGRHLLPPITEMLNKGKNEYF